MSTDPLHMIDQQLALDSAVTRLADEFGSTFDTATIERLLRASFDDLAAHAVVTTYVPVLAERFARQRLHALARVEERHDDTRPAVLFLCVHNAGRSQMALGYLQQYGGDRVIGWSGGSEPAAAVDEVAVAAMAERGIDIATEFPKPWTEETVRAADVVVTMGCGDTCPHYPGTRYEDWDLPDPANEDLAHVRPIRDEIERRVLSLLDGLDVAARP
ncbi:protein-tyrosine-phosphatase [Mumia flava]|uniref:Protein-tyrosine-phosphatase n=1 Tax=Mumia flava TaxID=1348852 RepID=A0A0B2BNY7_9ACTN|nr:arsenate reductase ArsC [Mumia flava]PJJ56567.1 protein-tyrosine-phosphatase [Mumia flava]